MNVSVYVGLCGTVHIPTNVNTRPRSLNPYSPVPWLTVSPSLTWRATLLMGVNRAISAATTTSNALVFVVIVHHNSLLHTA